MRPEGAFENVSYQLAHIVLILIKIKKVKNTFFSS